MDPQPTPHTLALSRLTTVLLAVWVVALTLWPFRPVPGLAAWGAALRSAGEVDWPVLLHLGLAFALGGAVAWGWPGRVGGAHWGRRLAVVLLLAVLLEVAQSLMVGRHATLSDVAAHTLGAAIGLAAGLRLAAGGRVSRRAATAGLWAVPIAAAGVSVVLAAVEYRLTGLHGWDDKALLVLGNEATGDRPWRGTIHGVAIYDEALEPRQARFLVRERFRSNRAVEARLRRHAVAVYSPADAYQLSSRTGLRWLGSSRLSDALDLYAEPDRGVVATPAGVNVRGEGVLGTAGPATPLTAALRRAGAFSVEAYVTPAALTQVGPARIVSLSRTPGKRNFTLAQEGRGLNVRVRTPLSGPNGDDRQADPTWDGVFIDRQPVHLVLTYGHGEIRLFVNGRPHGEPWRMQAVHRFAARAPGATPAATMALGAAVLLLPIGLVGPATWDRARRPVRAVAIWGGLAAVAAAAFHVAAGPGGIWFAVAAVAAGVLLGLRAYARPGQ